MLFETLINVLLMFLLFTNIGSIFVITWRVYDLNKCGMLFRWKKFQGFYYDNEIQRFVKNQPIERFTNLAERKLNEPIHVLMLSTFYIIGLFIFMQIGLFFGLT